MLTSDQMEMIILDYMLEREPRVTGKEAEDFLEQFKKDEALCKERGWKIELPFEIPDLSVQ